MFSTGSVSIHVCWDFVCFVINEAHVSIEKSDRHRTLIPTSPSLGDIPALVTGSSRGVLKPVAEAGRRVGERYSEQGDEDDSMVAQLRLESWVPEAPIPKHKADEIGQDMVRFGLVVLARRTSLGPLSMCSLLFVVTNWLTGSLYQITIGTL